MALVSPPPSCQGQGKLEPEVSYPLPGLRLTIMVSATQVLVVHRNTRLCHRSEGGRTGGQLHVASGIDITHCLCAKPLQAPPLLSGPRSTRRELLREDIDKLIRRTRQLWNPTCKSVRMTGAVEIGRTAFTILWEWLWPVSHRSIMLQTKVWN